jgi:hypothetical protein
VTDQGQAISQATKDWVETYVPDQTGANYTAHRTAGLDTVEHLKELQAEPFDAFHVQPVGLAVYQLGNNGTAHSAQVLAAQGPLGYSRRLNAAEPEVAGGVPRSVGLSRCRSVAMAVRRRAQMRATLHHIAVVLADRPGRSAT